MSSLLILHLSFLVVVVWVFVFETRSRYVALAGLELTV